MSADAGAEADVAEGQQEGPQTTDSSHPPPHTTLSLDLKHGTSGGTLRDPDGNGAAEGDTGSRSSHIGSNGTPAGSADVLCPEDLEVLAKMEEANR